jgi:glycosyltransferase involved in cell wall biosynthesis
MISVVIPAYTINKKLEDSTALAIKSLYDAEADEIILCEDGGFYSPLLMGMVDTYLYSKENVGFTKNVNRGVQLARHDFVAIVNSDVLVMRGSLQDLCINDRVTCPLTRSEEVPGLAGHFFVVPQAVFKQVGLLDERMKNFGSDGEFESRVAGALQHVNSVEIIHDLHQTIKAAGLWQSQSAESDYAKAAEIKNQRVR